MRGTTRRATAGDGTGARATVRVGVDGRVLTDRYHGIGRVAYELCRELARTPGVELVLFLGDQTSRRFDLAELVRLGTVSVRRVSMGPVDVRQLWRWRRVLRDARVDVVFFPYHLGASPLAGTPTVVLLHDCVFETDPRFVPSRRLRLAYRAMTSVVARTSTVLTVSRASAGEVERYYRRRVRPEQIIPNGVDQNLRGDAAGAERLRREFGLEPGYVLHVGAQRPHKNVAVLVEAIAALPHTRLVLVGSPDERFPDQVGPAIRRCGVADRVSRLPFVPEELLGSLYARAGLLAYPSLVEGFGLPVLEAMVAGTPVLASDVPVLREVGGPAALYVAPDRPRAWAEAIDRLGTDRQLRAELIAAGAAHAAGYTWAAAAERLSAALRAASSRRDSSAERATPR